MAVAQRMSEAAYLEFVNSGVEGAWELHDGRLVEKPGMSWKHWRIVTRAHRLVPISSLIRRNIACSPSFAFGDQRPQSFLPDVMVVPTAYGEDIRDLPVLAIFSEPLPLVVEVWSPSTGDYDVDAKMPVYQQRGDAEIWRIHPYEQTLTRWVRQPDGSYRETVHRGGAITPVALPGVTIDLDALFDG